MKNTTFTIIIDDDDIGTLTLKYELSVTRHQERDETGRKWYVPQYVHGLLFVDFAAAGASKSKTWDFKSGKDMDSRIKEVMKKLEGQIYHAIEDKVSSIVNDPQYEGNHNAEPND